MPALLHSPNARPNARTASGTSRGNPSGWSRLLGLAACRGTRFRFQPAASEGVARCVVLRVKRGKRTLRHVLAVVPEGGALDLVAVARLYGAGSASFVTPETAASVTGFSGPLAPYSADPAVELIVDQRLGGLPEMVFNDIRPDVSIAFDTGDLLALARPRLGAITA